MIDWSNIHSHENVLIPKWHRKLATAIPFKNHSQPGATLVGKHMGGNTHNSWAQIGNWLCLSQWWQPWQSKGQLYCWVAPQHTCPFATSSPACAWGLVGRLPTRLGRGFFAQRGGYHVLVTIPLAGAVRVFSVVLEQTRAIFAPLGVAAESHSHAQ